MDDSAQRALAAAVAAWTTPSIDTTEQALPNRGARSLPFGGGLSLLLGVVLVALGGVFILALWLAGGMSSRLATEAHDQLLMILFDLVFIIGLGVALACSGLLHWRRAARAKALKARHPDQPWFADSPWDTQGTFEQSAWSASSLFVIAFVFLVMGPWDVFLRYAFDTSVPLGARLLLPALLFIPNFFIYLVLKGVFSIVRDRLRFGRAYLAFDPFPFFLGETLAARVTAKRFAGQEGVVAVLRCIDERMASSRSTSGRTANYVLPHQVYEARQPFPGTFGGQDVPFTFAVPTQLPTELARQPPRYWELEIRGRQANDAVVFDVPVYARPEGFVPG